MLPPMLRPAIVTFAVLGAVASLAAACGPPVPCIDVPCVCDGTSPPYYFPPPPPGSNYAEGEYCELDCRGRPDCDPTCTDIDGCIARCLEPGCDFLCKSGRDCRVDCGANCKVSCTSANNCDARTGPDSSYSCEAISDCKATIDDGSTARCNSVSTCNITCTGKCTVTCTSVGSCNVDCANEAAQTSAPATDCKDSRHVCGGPC